MKNVLKRSFSVFLAITIIFSSACIGLNELDFSRLFSVEAKAASSGTCGENLTWILDDNGNLTISGTGEMEDFGSFNAPWYSVRSSIKNVVVNSGVTSIRDYAFYNCTNLTSITIPDSVTSIGYYICSNTDYYNDVNNWENDVLYIGNYLIEAKDTIVGDYTVKDGTKVLATHAFNSCSELTSIDFPNSVISIGDCAFMYCTGLTSVCLPDGVTSIGESAFRECTNLMSITISDSVISIGSGAFRDCEELSCISLPNTITNIDDFTFYGCRSLTLLTIPDTVANIGEWAFGICESLTSITIPDGVTSIGESAFEDCRNLSEINVDKNNSQYLSEDGVLFNKDKTILIQYPTKKTETTYTIPDSVTTIKQSAFNYCSNLKSVIIPDSVTHMGDTIFYECINLESITMSSKLKVIGLGTFYNCRSLASVIIPDSVTYIGDSAFYCCTSLNSITISDNITSIGYCAFVSTAYYNNESNWNNDVLYLGKYLINAKTNLAGSYTVKEGTKVIADYAFTGRTGAYWGASIPGCTNLTSIIIPASVINVGNYAFYKCENLTSVELSNGVKKIGDYAFYNCTNLNLITIPDSVTYLGNSVFNGCESLVSVIIPDSVTSIGYQAFAGCTSLTSITISNSVTSIGNYAFKDCSSLTSITIPNSVSTIGERAFEYCNSLTTIILGIGVENIRQYAFSGCTNLKDVYYIGNKDDYSKILIEVVNGNLTKATIHYNYGHTHILSDWIIDEKATCAVAGSKHKECTVCGETFETQSIAKTGHKSSDWITDKEATVNATGKKHKECTECGEVLETATIKQLKCSKPKFSKIENTSSGVKITWGKVSGADSYEIYRKTSGGSYKKIGTTSKTSYTDKKASSGKKYYYIVKAINEAGSSSASSSKSIYHLADTTLSTPKSTKSGITLKWKKVTGADGYMVYRKTGSGSYSKIATVKGNSKVTYTDKKAKKGKTYTYKIRAYKSKTYSAYSNAKKIKDKY